MSNILADQNNDRADRCEAPLALFSQAAYGFPESEDAATRIMDLICNLLHLAQREGENPAAIMESAFGHYCAERADPDGIGPDTQASIEVNGFSPASAIFPRLDALAKLILAAEDSASETDDEAAAINAAVKACMSPGQA